MKFIFMIILLIFHWFAIKKIGEIISEKFNIKYFKKSVFLAPISIIFSLILIRTIGLSSQEAGFILGDAKEGFRSVCFIGLPLAIISGGLIFTIPKENLKEVKYGEKQVKWEFIYVWIFVGFVEEIIFRGFVQGTLDSMIDGHLFAFSYAVIVSSIVFVLIHIGNVLYKQETWKAFFSMIPTRLIAALVLGYSFQVSRSIIYSVIIHNLIDGLNMSALYLRKKAIRGKYEV